MKRRRTAIALFERAIERGEIAPGTNLEMLVDLISGFSWYRKLITGIEIREDEAETMASLLLCGISASDP